MRRHHRTSAGFTVIEILIAVVVSSVGFAAVFAMQLGSMQGNISAREMAAATNLAESTVARLRHEAYTWTADERPNSPILGVAPETWHSLTPQPVDHNNLAYRNGGANDGVSSPLARQRFCIHYWIGPNSPQLSGVLTLRVRVIWPTATLDPSTLDTLCNEANAVDLAPDEALDVATFRSIVLPAAIRRHAS